MPVDPVHREDAIKELRRVVRELKEASVQNRLAGAEMILGCRQVLNLWIDTGGSSLDDPVIGFLGIESQTSHVLGGPGVRAGRDGDRVRFKPGSKEEAVEVEEIYRVFAAGFTRDVEELSLYLGG